MAVKVRSAPEAVAALPAGPIKGGCAAQGTTPTAIKTGLRSVLEAVSAGRRCAFSERVTPTVETIDILRADLTIDALCWAGAAAVNVRLGTVEHRVSTRRVRADVGYAPGLETIGIDATSFAICARGRARTAVCAATIFVRFTLILHSITTSRRGALIVRPTDSVDAIAGTRTAEAGTTLTARGSAAAVGAAFALVLNLVATRGDRASSSSIEWAYATQAIRRNFTLQAVRALGTGTSTAVLIRFGAVLDEVVALRLSTDATDAADIGDGRVAIGL